MSNIKYEKRAQVFICALVVIVIGGIINSYFSQGHIYLFLGAYAVGLAFTYLFNYLVKNFVLNKMKNIIVKNIAKFILTSLIVLSVGVSAQNTELALKNYVVPLVVWFIIDWIKLGFKAENTKK